MSKANLVSYYHNKGTKNLIAVIFCRLVAWPTSRSRMTVAYYMYDIDPLLVRPLTLVLSGETTYCDAIVSYYCSSAP